MCYKKKRMHHGGQGIYPPWCIIYYFSPDFVEMATFLARNAGANLPILNPCRMRMRRLSITPCKSYYFLYFSMFLSRVLVRQK